MTRWWELLAVLALWAAIVTVRRKRVASSQQSPQSPSGAQGGGVQRTAHSDPDIDYDELEQAEREVRDLDTDAKGRPLDEGIGDDWGPGTPKPPYT